jgi:tyrosinase
MATYTRSNAWINGGSFSNDDLLWYAKGVGVMMTRTLDDPSSWWFYAAIHGQSISTQWGQLPIPPQVPTKPLPPPSVSAEYWDQCQHASWYFLPWHRGYLIALEAQVRAAIVKLGGPSTWALPYWDYFGPQAQYNMPPAFAQPLLPDGTRNPLFVEARYGPDGDSQIYVPTQEAIDAHPGDPNFFFGPVTQINMQNTIFTGSDANTPDPGFGGPETGFWHGGFFPFGNLESDPHNFVHVYVGGGSAGQQQDGLMTDTTLAALDPIFYLHHANIDRMWAVWNTTATNTNPTDPKWLDGPAAQGEHNFAMPMPDGTSFVFTPQQMSDLSQLDYTYDSLPTIVTPPPSYQLAQRLTRLGAPAAAARAIEGVPVTTGQKKELVGASQEAIPVKGAGASAAVRLDPAVRRKVSTSLARAAETAAPDRVYLNLENVRGTRNASVLSVFINLPEGAKPGEHPELLAGSVALFGLRSASVKDDKHGGEGLNFLLDITKVVDTLHLRNALDTDALQVRIVPNRPVPDEANITIGRISIYRQGM